jgi:hypothetical protein
LLAPNRCVLRRRSIRARWSKWTRTAWPAKRRLFCHCCSIADRQELAGTSHLASWPRI